MDWIDVKAQLKIAICDLHFLQQVVVDDDCYNMTWCIPHVVTDTLSLHTEPDYQHFMKKALKCKPNLLQSQKAGSVLASSIIYMLCTLT